MVWYSDTGLPRLHWLKQVQASKFILQNNIMTVLIQDVNNTTAGYKKEIPSIKLVAYSKYSVYDIKKWSERSVRSKHKDR